MTVILGCSRRGAKDLALHITNAEKNERVMLLESRGTIASIFGAESGPALQGHAIDALREMEALAAGTKCKNPLYHVKINPMENERLSPEEQWGRAIDMTLESLGIDDRYAVFAVLHEKKGRQHVHLVIGRIDPDTMTAWHDGKNYAKHEMASRAIEREFNLERTQGVHVERDPDRPRSERRPSSAEMQMAARAEFDLQAFRQVIREVKRAADSPQTFIAALEEGGRILAQGKQRAFVVIDERGEVHSLARTLGERTKAVKEWLQDIDVDALPRVPPAQHRYAQAEERMAALAARANNSIKTAAPLPTAYDREAEAVRQATALIDGAAKAAPELARRQEQEQRASEKAARDPHAQRLSAVLAALPGEPCRLFEAQHENQIVFAHDKGRVAVTTSRAETLLSYDEGERVLAAFAARDRTREGVEQGAFHAGQLPSLDDARRMAYGLERRAELACTVTDAFAATAEKRDGGVAFVEGLAGHGLTLRSDQAKRLHIIADGREYRLDQFISDRDQETHLPELVARKPVPGVEIFKSAADRGDEREQKRDAFENRQFARQLVAAIQEPVRAVETVAAKTQPVVRTAAAVASAPARLAGGLANGVTNLMAGLGKHTEQSEAARRPAAPPTPQARAAAPATTAREQLRQQNMTERPDLHTQQLAKMHSGLVDQELRDRLRRLEEEYKRDNERAPDGSRGRERSR